MRHTLRGYIHISTTVIIILLLIIIIILGGILWKQNQLPQTPPLPTATPTLSPTPTFMGIAPTNTPYPTPTLSPTQGVSDGDQLRQLFAKKYNHPVSDAIVTISKQDPTHISGGIKFQGEMAGGWFLAAKTGGNWVIVQDGNGTIDCATIAPYNFSSDMVPECWDEKTQKLIKR